MGHIGAENVIYPQKQTLKSYILPFYFFGHPRI